MRLRCGMGFCSSAVTIAVLASVTACSGSAGSSPHTGAADATSTPATITATAASATGSKAPSPSSTSRSVPAVAASQVTSAAVYAFLLAGPFKDPDLPSAVKSIGKFEFADGPPVGYLDGVRVVLAPIQETAALSLSPTIDFWVMKTPEYAVGFAQEAHANFEKYTPKEVVDESKVAQGAWCNSGQATCTAVVGRVVIELDAGASTYGASNGLDVNVPSLAAAIRYARSAGA